LKTLPELTAFCSTYDKFVNSDLSNFDSVYLGTPYCLSVKGNLLVDIKKLKPCIRELKKVGKKAYVTTPAVPIGNDFNVVEKTLKTAVDEEADGVEVFDMGIFRLVKNRFPELQIHIGHYANVYNKFTAKVFIDYGASRVIPSYELTFDETEQLAQIPGIELEVAVHGKLPLGYANACLLRLEFPSRNLEACEQQCNKEHFVEFSDWKMKSAGTAMLMGTDTCLIDRLPDYVDAGFKALRLDTITETADKISALGSLYRKALNIIGEEKEYPADELLAEAKEISGEICNGWQTGTSGRNFMIQEELLNIPDVTLSKAKSL
jgi:putative protease